MATFEIALYVDAHPLKPDKESVIGVWGGEHGVRRLVYGEFQQNGYRLLWDSPLFSGFFLTMGYHDVDANGAKEIVLRARYGKDGQMVVVFT